MNTIPLVLNAARLAIAAASWGAAAAIWYGIAQRSDFRYRRLGFLLSAVLFSCGAMHLLNAAANWYPVSGAAAGMAAVTALLSALAAILFMPLVPRLLSLPSPTALAQANARLEQEVAVRRAAEEELRITHGELEARVAERTAELVAANQRLEREIRERRQVQDNLYQAIEEREALLREVHHRVKNNLQMMTSLLNLQIRSETSEVLRQKLREMQTRINALSIVHKKLYGGEDLAAIDVGNLLGELCKQLGMAYRTDQNEIQFDVQAESILTDMDHAIPLALLTTEAVTNALKYAFPEGRSGIISVSLARQGPSTVLRIADDGVGMPAKLEDVATTSQGSLGLTLMRGMARQLDGKMEIRSGNGVEVRVAMKTENLTVNPGLRKTA